jgi:hypothetical protein
MGAFINKFISAFSYGAGFMLAVVCAIYAVNQYSNSSVQVASSGKSSSKPNNNNLELIELNNISKLSNFVNYGAGNQEQFIFTGEITNSSSDEGFEKLIVEVDLYNSDDKFIFKCGGWDGSGINLVPQETVTFQNTCHNMPAEIATKYHSHKALVKQRKF